MNSDATEKAERNRIGERLKLVRGTTSQGEYSKLLGVTTNTIGRYERGERTPDIDYVAAFCKATGVNPRWLILGEEPMYDVDRDIKFVAGPGTKAGDLRGYKFSEISGGPAFDTSAANLQAKWREIASALPEGSEDADMEKAFLYHRIKQLEAELAQAKEELLKAKDEAIRAQNMALQTLTDVGMKHSTKVAVDLLNALRKGGGYKDVIEMLQALHKTQESEAGIDDEPETSIMQKMVPTTLGNLGTK